MLDSPVIVSLVDADRRTAALRMLFSRFPQDEQDARLQDALQSVERGSLDLSGLLLAEQNAKPVGASLVMRQPDGVALVWPPVAMDEADEFAVCTALMDRVCVELDKDGVKFGQCLLAPDETVEAEWLQRSGFQVAAELFFLARALEAESPTETLPTGATVETFDEQRNAAQFAALIEQTYSGSLDCPMLNGHRTGVDALASHRLSGQFHPRGWRLYRQDDREAAVLLLNEHPDQDAVELVYFGVAPEFRGQNWGRRLLGDAIAVSRSWNRVAIFLAVDAGNTFANRLYAEQGFQEVARRAVWLRFPESLARQ